MKDLTIVMLTPNKVPKEWALYHKKMLLEAIEDTPLITISNEPLDFGQNLIQTDYGVTNIYKQMFRAFKLAKTPFVAMADDDTLYSKEHFEFRPPMNKFAYNFNRWHLFTWGRAYYFHKPRPGNGLMIAPRKLAIKAIEARFTKIGKGKMPTYLRQELGSTIHVEKYDKAGFVSFYTYIPVVSFYHIQSCDPLNRHKRKVPWTIQAFDLPKWRKAKHLRKKFNE